MAPSSRSAFSPSGLRSKNSSKVISPFRTRRKDMAESHKASSTGKSRKRNCKFNTNQASKIVNGPPGPARDRKNQKEQPPLSVFPVPGRHTESPPVHKSL